MDGAAILHSNFLQRERIVAFGILETNSATYQVVDGLYLGDRRGRRNVEGCRIACWLLDVNMNLLSSHRGKRVW